MLVYIDLSLRTMTVLIQAAIKSLDYLNDQIVQFIFTPSSSDNGFVSSPSKRERETLKSSMSVMRSLLVDAQAKFRKMVEDNRNLASRIDGSIQAANEEVTVLRLELSDANKRLSDLSEAAMTSNEAVNQTVETKDEYSSPMDGSDAQPSGEYEQIKVPTEGAAASSNESQLEQLKLLETENARLTKEVNRLNSELESLRHIASKEWGGERKEADGDDGCGQEEPPTVSKEINTTSLETELFILQQELARAQESMLVMKSDRKRLKSEKLELLSQLKQLYSNLEDKETELRSFIRSYEQRMYQADHTIKQLAAEKDASEKEKWQFRQEAEEAKHCLALTRTDLENKESIIRSLQTQLNQMKTQSTISLSCEADQVPVASQASVESVGMSGSKDGLTNTCGEELPTYQEVSMSAEMTGIPVFHNRDSKITLCDSQEKLVEVKPSPRSREPTPTGSVASAHSNTSACNLSGVSGVCERKTSTQLDLPQTNSEKSAVAESTDLGVVHRRHRDCSRDSARDRRRKSPGPLSRMFGKSRSRRSLATSDPNIDENLLSSRLSILTQDNYQEKLGLVGAALKEHVGNWRANHVLAWLELEMNMPSYGRACSENIKSGKVLLGLSDAELDSALGLETPLHRRKLRLAIEELRDPSTVKYPHAGSVSHTWVADYFLADVGLPQYASVFREQLVDGRLLNVITKRDLERHLSVQRKFHQTSILHGVDMLRRLQFNKEALRERQNRSENNTDDPLVWTNHRLICWLESIDLHEYAQNLQHSGVHGSVLVLEQNFTADAFATALGVPHSKSYVRRHLATELDSLIRPARIVAARRAALEAANKRRPPSAGSLGRSFSRSYKTSDSADNNGSTNKRISLRGSFGKAFGNRKNRQESDSSHQPSSTHVRPIRRSSSMELTTSVM